MTDPGRSELDVIADLLDDASAVHAAAGRVRLAEHHRLAAARLRPAPAVR